MKSLSHAHRSFFLVLGLLVVLGLTGCATDDFSSATNNPGVENPAAASPNSIIPAVGIAGNGGGISGGGAGAQ